MRKTTLSFCVIISIIGLIISCKKTDNYTPAANQSNITAITKQRTVIAFDNDDSLSIWNVNNSASFIIDKNNKAVGLGALCISENTGCFYFSNIEGFKVKKSTNYKLSIKSKIDSIEHVGACASNFSITLKENNTEIIDQESLNYHSLKKWNDNIYYFRTDSTGLPIQLKFYLNYKKVWLDQLVIEEL